MMSAFPLQATCSAASSSFNSASSSQLSRVPGGDPPLHRVRLLLLQILLVLLLYRIHVWRYERLLHGVEGAASSSTSLSAYRCFLSGLVSSSLHWGQAVILSEEQELMMCCSLHNASMPLPGTRVGRHLPDITLCEDFLHFGICQGLFMLLLSP